MPKYVGQSNAYDIPNNIIYLGDLLFAWDVGDDLTGWTLGGTTVPTIAVDGRLKLYDNSVAALSNSMCRIVIPNTMGQLYCIFKCKITQMADDTSTDDRKVVIQIDPGTVNENGHIYLYNKGTNSSTHRFWNTSYLGSGTIGLAWVPVAGIEYELSLIMTPKSLIMLINGVMMDSIPISNKGTAPSSLTPLADWLKTNKTIQFFVRHLANEVSHYRIRDIRVSAYRGQS